MNLLLLSLSLMTASQDIGERVILSPDMLLNETAIGDPIPLVDEQSKVGDPASIKGIVPTKPFFPGWTAWQYPLHVAIDLKGEYEISKIFVYNETGESPLTISTGLPFAWKPKPFKLNLYKDWVEMPINEKTRWLRITLTQPTSVSELVVYGKKLSAVVPTTSFNKPRELPTMDQLIGTNAFIDDPIDTITTPVTYVREYHPWLWDLEGPDKLRRFQPSGAAGGKSWFFDDYYAKLKAKGAVVCPVVWEAPLDMFGTSTKEAKPIVKGSDSENPASYEKHASHLFQFAARYGSKKQPDNLLDLAPGEPRKSGLGLLQYIENWNEPDKTWEGREGRFHPYELAAMSSADYDGHQGKMGKTAGVKNADPKMKLVMGGLAGLHLDFIQAMKFWADYNRGGHFPADVLNLHTYSSTAQDQGFKPGDKGISPEEDKLREKLTKIADWRDKNLADKELWLTEFGYDTNPGSPLHVPTLGKMSPEQVQAAWLIRSYLAIAAARWDKAAQFMLRDVKSVGAGVFETCGLVTEKGDWKPKPSWYFIATLKNRLKGYRFGAEVPSGSADVTIFRFDSSQGKAFVLWCPTSSDKQVPGYALTTGNKATELITFANGTITGNARALSPSNGQVKIDVSETPVIVLVKS